MKRSSNISIISEISGKASLRGETDGQFVEGNKGAMNQVQDFTYLKSQGSRKKKHPIKIHIKAEQVGEGYPRISSEGTYLKTRAKSKDVTFDTLTVPVREKGCMPYAKATIHGARETTVCTYKQTDRQTDRQTDQATHRLSRLKG